MLGNQQKKMTLVLFEVEAGGKISVLCEFVLVGLLFHDLNLDQGHLTLRWWYTGSLKMYLDVS